LKWEARYNVDGVKRNIGTYDNALDAARARRDFVQRVNASRPAAAAEQVPAGDQQCKEVTPTSPTLGRKQKSWYIYGQKVLKGKEYVGKHAVRVYYRCNFLGCKVKKQVEKIAGMPGHEKVVITGVHTHAELSPSHASMQNNPNYNPHAPRIRSRFFNTSHKTYLVILCPAHSITFVSCGIAGYSPKELIGSSFNILLQTKHNSINEQELEKLREAIAFKEEVHIVVLIAKKDGSGFWARLQLTPVVFNGEVSSWVVWMIDVSVPSKKRCAEDRSPNVVARKKLQSESTPQSDEPTNLLSTNKPNVFKL